MTEAKQKELVKLQREILSVIEQYVKPGGILMYSTCTINKEENIENVNWFIKHHDFELESITKNLSIELQSETTDLGYIQLLPENHGTDGFFIAKLKKKG